jgi:serine protease Do
MFAVAALLVFQPLVWGSAGTSVSATYTPSFTGIAKKAIPTVVFIKVEKSIETGRPGRPFEFNNPFDQFNEEFFRRFFGPQFPRQERPREYKQMGMGSGFIFSDEGYIFTNHHVVGDADKITVRLADGREFDAKVSGSDPKSDLAIIKIDGVEDLPVLPLGNSDDLEVGEWVMAVGNPFGLSHTLTVGVVSAKGRTTVGITDYEDFIQTDAAINPGNSGGPLINLKGEAIGINSAIFSKSGGYMGIGFAIPINMVKNIKDQLITHGEVSRGYLGVGIQDLDKDLVESFGLSGTEGVLVAEVAKDSPAAKAGIRQGDVIVEFNGNKVKDVGQFRNMVSLTLPETKVKLTVITDGKKKVLTATLEALDKAQISRAVESKIMNKLGFTVQDLSKEMANRFGYNTLQGVLISQVVPGSPAHLAGIQPGLLILEVNRRKVKNAKDFNTALADSVKSKKVLLLITDGHHARYVILNID